MPADDDDWVDALLNDDPNGPEDARLIRALMQAHEESSSEGIAGNDVQAAKDKLLQRLKSERPNDGNVVGIETRRSQTLANWTREKSTFLIAASAAIIAIGILTLGGIFPRDDLPSELLMYYGELETTRGDVEENIAAVENPDETGQRLARHLIDQQIPFELWIVSPESTERLLRIQVDGIENPDEAWAVLNSLGIYEASTSVVDVNLVAEE